MILEDRNITTIYSGEYYISDDPHVVIYTLLGSCIAVCLYDELNCIGGMNHFMLPQAVEGQHLKEGCYGLQSLELMIKDLLNQGARYQNLKAKIFGGGKMVGFSSQKNDISLANIRFALKYLESKQIPIIAKELGGTLGRKIYYVLADHSVYVQRLNREVNFSDGSRPVK
ncbi:MAG TPA: chemotaxis protein CheD [Firmicutes bacterium]|nr:chemotaxis protein CheD [Bacillota bacterium]